MPRTKSNVSEDRWQRLYALRQAKKEGAKHSIDAKSDDDAVAKWLEQHDPERLPQGPEPTDYVPGRVPTPEGFKPPPQ